MADERIAELRPEAFRARIRWLLLARVLIVTIFLGATAVTHARADSDPDFPLREVAILIVIAYLFSLGSATFLQRIHRVRAFAWLQIAADVLLISAAVPLTGGLRSPMAVWYNLAIIAAALLLFRRGAFVTAALSSLAYGALMNLIYYGAIPETLVYTAKAVGPGFAVVYQIAANIGSFFSIAFLSSILVERLARTEWALERSEQTLQRISALQRTLVQNLESGVLTTDHDGRIESTNRAIETILARPATELVGRRIVEIFPVLRLPVGAKRILGPNPVPTEISYSAAPNGPRRLLRCVSATLTDTYENPIGMLFILQDITEISALLEQRDAADAEHHATEAASLGESKPPALEGLVGQSGPIEEVVRLVHKVAPTDSTVLLTGESGTGKELAARAIHALSPRKDKPMVVVNCAAIPENLIESELFGHVRGAYTGAVSDRRGLFRAADGGSIFLDEIGDLPLPLQVKLLRVLQERSFTPVGSQVQVAVDVRIIAATNRDLEAEVAKGRFRDDLFYRLNVIRIQMPPLRERKEDLPILVQHFLGRFSETLNRAPRRISTRAMQRLLSYAFPGNIRELENVIEHAVALSSGDVIDEVDLPEKLRNGHEPHAPAATEGAATTEPSLDWMHAKGANLDTELEEVEKRLIEEALRRAGGIRKRAAEILGINYRSLRHRLDKYGFGEGQTKELPE